MSLRTGFLLTGVGLSVITCTAAPQAEGGGPLQRQLEQTSLIGTLGPLPGPTVQPALSTDSVRYLLVPGATAIPSSLERAVVEVCGAPSAADGPLRRLTVDRFDLLAIDGQRALLGTLKLEDGLLSIQARQGTWRLVGPVDELRARLGERIWVQGTFQDDRVVVTTYGGVE